MIEQQEHLNFMMAAAVVEALTAHSSKDQLSQKDFNKTNKQNNVTGTKAWYDEIHGLHNVATGGFRA